MQRIDGAWAVVTGAGRSEGLGFAFARDLAQRGWNLGLVDILGDEVEQRAKEIRATTSVQAKGICLDLGSDHFVPPLLDALGDVEVGCLVCNHMYTPPDTPTVLDMDLEVHLRMLDINARAYTILIHTFGNRMRERGRGTIVVVSSGAGILHAPYTGAYSANKAFQIGLGETLWYELQGTGVDVVTLAAGLMDTQGDALDKYPKALIANPVDVVRETLAGVGRKPTVVPGWLNRLFFVLQTRLMSRKQAVNSIGDFMKKGLGK